MAESEPIGVLFVCLGNICRSPLAEGIFTHLVRQRGVQDQFVIDSCGTGAWHIGKSADRRMLAVAGQRGIELTSIARQFDRTTDPSSFAWFIAMDRSNQADLLAAGTPRKRTVLLRQFDPQSDPETDPHRMDVPDPYYGGPDGFDEVYELVWRGCEGLLEALLR